MARIIFPEDFATQNILLSAVKEKHEADGPASVLTPYLTQKSINLVTDRITMNSAIVHEKNRLKWANESENWFEKRDGKWEPVMARMRSYYQFLKKFYKPDYTEVGLWGAPITTTGKISYPESFIDRTVIFDLLKVKYDTYAVPPPPTPSPLDPFLTQHTFSITTDNTAKDTSRTYHNSGVSFSNQSEDATQDRDNLRNPVVQNLRGIGGFLMALHNNNPKQVGLYGFTVDDSPRAPKEVVSKVKLSDSITIRGVIIGGTFKNIGNVALNIYKGETATGAFVSVLPNDMYGIAKGYSSITVVNPSPTATGVFSVLRSK